MTNRAAHALTLRLDDQQYEHLRRVSFAVRRPISVLIREAVSGHHWHATGVWCDECPPAAQSESAPAPESKDEQS